MTTIITLTIIIIPITTTTTIITVTTYQSPRGQASRAQRRS